MKIAFLASDKPREQHLADAFLMGARRHGHTTEIIPLDGESNVGAYDVACMCGVKSRALFHAHRKEAITTIYLDKGYVRDKRHSGGSGWEYWRFSVNHHHPTWRLPALTLSSDRIGKFELELKPWRKRGRTVLIAGSSAKYHDFYGMSEPNQWARKLYLNGRLFTGREWVYRPKPSWQDGAPFKGAVFSAPPETIDDVLAEAWCMVTHGSNACFEAVLAGVPTIVLGEAVAKPISSTRLEDLEAPRLASDAERWQWLANLAWFQWSLAEMASGAAWDFIGSEVHA